MFIILPLPFSFDCVPAEVRGISNCKCYTSSRKIACKCKEGWKTYCCYADLKNLAGFIKPNGKLHLKEVKCNPDPYCEEFKNLELKLKLPQFCLTCVSF